VKVTASQGDIHAFGIPISPIRPLRPQRMIAPSPKAMMDDDSANADAYKSMPWRWSRTWRPPTSSCCVQAVQG